ncbi:hypothetical protein MKX01_006042 [Papaver californicum]|nr:hypothetical protein MKX01_006042 [Papaver californicum]
MTRFNGGGGDDDHRKLIEDYNSEQEEEALSLCDLPIKEEVNQQNIKSSKAASLLEEGEEFEFGSWVGSVLTESEICVADDVFFQGQILPLRRHSVSSENGFSLKRQESNPSVTMNPSRSSSLRSSSGVYTTSSRSSSSKSHNSISSTSTSTTTSGHYKPLQNIFHSHPSPKPQIWNSSSNSKSIRRNVSGKQSTTWGLFRVGLVKTPQIELLDLRLRNYKSFNSSCSSSGSSNKSSSIKNICSTDTNNGSNGRRLSKGTGNDNGDKKKMQRFYLGFESCKCSTDAVENSVSSKFVVIKGSLINSKKKMSSSNGSELMKEEVIIKKEKEDDHHIDDEKDMIKKENKEQEKKKQKELMNHLRTFEWLKELSVADVPD